VLRSFFASSIVILLPKISTTTTRVSAMLLGIFLPRLFFCKSQLKNVDFRQSQNAV